MSLQSRIIEIIDTQGPITVAEYMALCLLDPTEGYYPTRDPLGSDGDFITAPEISQMFGELLGLWVVQSWEDMGRPETLHLVEMGPGRGVMMSDMLRAMRTKPALLKAVTVHLIEASAALEAVQARTLARSGVSINWASDLTAVPDGPTIIVGNEYLDCLPIRQFIKKPNAWHERLVVENEGELDFGLSPEPVSQVVLAGFPQTYEMAKDGDMLEINLSALQVLDQVSDRFKSHQGRALFIDYGPSQTEFGDTLQALKRHQKVGVFSDPGNTDLTARVDFGALAEFAARLGTSAYGPVAQAEFLSRMGIETRAGMLVKSKPDAKDVITRQFKRLMTPGEMGELFKVICFQSEGLSHPVGFGD